MAEQTSPLERWTLAEIREALEAASRLAERIRELENDEWMDAEGAAKYMGWKSAESFLKTDAPRHYLSSRVIRFHREELRRWGKGKPSA